MTDKTTAERAKFEAWALANRLGDYTEQMGFRFHDAGNMYPAWQAWQARASLPLPGAQEAVAWRYRMAGDLQWQYTERKEQFAHADEVQPLAAPQPALSAGWVMVPVEPTEEMKAAAVKYANGTAVYKNVKAEVLRIEEGIYGEVYEAMIAAAPPLASEAKGDGNG